MSLNPANANNAENFNQMLNDFSSLRLEDDNDIWNKVTAKGYRPTTPFRCLDCVYKTRSYKNRLKHRMLTNHRFGE